jgi:anti-sigma factor RsiW
MNELDRTWAETQVEAMVDGGLPPASEQRMRSLLEQDPSLRRQVELARRLRRDLARLSRRPAPAGLWRQLWNIPAADRPKRSNLVPAIVVASVAVVALSISLWTEPDRLDDERAQQAAVADFAIAMGYLQKGVLVATSQVNQSVGAGMMNAYVVSRNAIGTEPDRSVEGEQGNDD